MSLWADELRYWPVAVKPYTPAQAAGVPFRAVVAESLYGDHLELRRWLAEAGVGYVLALKPSHSWWHPVEEVARAAPFSEEQSGQWVKIRRRFRGGGEQTWWVLEGSSSAYSPERSERLVIVTRDPVTLPEQMTWQMVTNLPVPGSPRAQESPLAGADLAEVVRLYGLRVWVEQSYKQVKGSLGWAQYQVRSDLALRRHWTLVFVAFSFCWWVVSRLEEPLLAFEGQEQPEQVSTERAAPTQAGAEGEKKGAGGRPERTDLDELAGGAASGAGVARALPHAATLLAGVVRERPTGVAAGAAGLARDRPTDLPLLPMTTKYW